MPISKRTLLIAGAAAGLSTGALAQTAGSKKSTTIGKVDEGEVLKINPKTGNLQKSNIKVSAARHQAAMAKGAKEISPSTVVYKQGGKMYMFDYQAAANTQAAENFQDQFDEDY